ncbi:MAG: WYL domain-containing protein [Opitutaceae bacterium]|nr:WYL domain-containing protein [Opitutaceae bacterium]
MSRPPLERMMRIHEELQDNTLPNCTKLAALLEVSTKTVMRDLAFMRDRLGLPVEYDGHLYAYRYGYPVKSFPTVQISEGELLALIVAQRALEQYQGTPYHGQLAHAFAKLSAGLRDKVSFAPTESLRTVSFHHMGLGNADLQVFERLSRALHESLEVGFSYRKPGSPAVEQRRVQPYHLANRENFWYLIGHDLDRNALRHFAVTRMRNVKVAAGKFERPADFSPEKHFGKSFGAFVGMGDYRVAIRFSADVADRIKERFWHESQETRDLPDGGLEMKLQLDNLDEVERWVITWGDDARAVAPGELVDRIRERIRQLAKHYRD